MLVTVSGLPGSGTSTVARLVAAQLGLGHVDGGTIFRQLAAERGMDVHAFGAYAEGSPEVDVALDERLANAARAGAGEGGARLVLESRLAGWIATNEGLAAVRVWIECHESVRAERVADRDGLDQAAGLAANRAREASERARYHAYYGIDMDDLSIYDLVVDSATASPEEIAAQIVALAQSRLLP